LIPRCVAVLEFVVRMLTRHSSTTASPQSPLLRMRATNKIPQIELVLTKHAQRAVLVPIQKEEPVGVERLRELTK